MHEKKLLRYFTLFGLFKVEEETEGSRRKKEKIFFVSLIVSNTRLPLGGFGMK